jgi:hypothetical protein
LPPRLVETSAEIAAQPSLAGRYIAALVAGGVPGFITNASSRPMLLLSNGRALPLTVDDGGYGRTYVASPHSAFVLYAREETYLIDSRAGRAVARALLRPIDWLLRRANINRAVHIDNWLLSTNLHHGWNGEDLPAVRKLLAPRFPTHLLIVRSLDCWSSPALLAAARDDGWILVPTRQIWVVDDLAREWRPRNNTANDRRALAASGLTVEDPGPFSAADADRVAKLYRLLYVGRHSQLNPQFTADFVLLTQRIGLVAYRIARNASGEIMAFAGMVASDGMMTPPLVGYDTARPRKEALYRIASWIYTDWAMARGFRLHGSAGAADFKRRRGARGEIEYMAIQAGHLSAARRSVIRVLAAMIERFVVPLMRRQGW